MTRQANNPPLTEFDLMVLRAGGRTQAEVEASALYSADIRCRIREIIADGLYLVLKHFGVGSNRSNERAQHRHVTRRMQ